MITIESILKFCWQITPERYIDILSYFLHQVDSYFSGSGPVSGVLVFSVVSALLGLVRAAYEEKSEYFASLSSNALQSAQWALDLIQKTNESVMMLYYYLSTYVPVCAT